MIAERIADLRLAIAGVDVGNMRKCIESLIESAQVLRFDEGEGEADYVYDVD